MILIRLILATFISGIFIFTASADASAQNIDAKKVGISYYAKSEYCQKDHTILVRVKYKTTGTNHGTLYITHKYENGSQISQKVDKIDKKGNIVYDFCIQKNRVETIQTIFKTEDGKVSNSIDFIIDTEQAVIISGTPPKTLRI